MISQNNLALYQALCVGRDQFCRGIFQFTLCFQLCQALLGPVIVGKIGSQQINQAEKEKKTTERQKGVKE